MPLVMSSFSAPEDGRRRVVIEGVSPEIEGGRYPAKRVVGDSIRVECDLVCDGHDVLAGVLLYRKKGEANFRATPLAALTNDRYVASFVVDAIGTWEFTFSAWTDQYFTFRRGLERKVAAGQDVAVELLIGARLLTAAAERARRGADVESDEALARAAKVMGDEAAAVADRVTMALSSEIAWHASRYPDRSTASQYERVVPVTVDPVRARFSSWYELFPRSWGPPGKHGTFKDVEAKLGYIAKLGFDTLYFPPIHPIGRSFRKGPNNTLTAGPGDPGSPWAIGADAGGHKAIHPELGSLEDFRRLVAKAKELGILVALDVAFQVSPDHPYVKEHPEWFVHRPDGTIQYAENPPKKYQDVYPFDFESSAWQALWEELKSVFLYWISEGITVFRVDNPHTKSLPFWRWCIQAIKADHPETLFLAEAFTRPKLMYALAKGGFTQSYTYFTWRNTKREFIEYLTELTRPPVSDFFRPNFWPNTPDILPEHLQYGGRAVFLQRLILAATLSSNYGIYGPAFELMEHVARPGSEEYLDNEKFQLRSWNLNHPDSLAEVIARINRIRRENRALWENGGLVFHETDNEQLLAYSKRSTDGESVVIVVVNLDGHHKHSGFVDLAGGPLGIAEGESFQVHDLLSDERYRWKNGKNFVELDPNVMPAHVFVLRRRVRREQDFEYFL